jgi:hypothetical protein
MSEMDDGLRWLAGEQTEGGAWLGKDGDASFRATCLAGGALVDSGLGAQGYIYGPHVERCLVWVARQVTRPEREIRLSPEDCAWALLLLRAGTHIGWHKREMFPAIERLLASAKANQLPNGGWAATTRQERPQLRITALHLLAIGVAGQGEVSDQTWERLYDLMEENPDLLRGTGHRDLDLVLRQFLREGLYLDKASTEQLLKRSRGLSVTEPSAPMACFWISRLAGALGPQGRSLWRRVADVLKSRQEATGAWPPANDEGRVEQTAYAVMALAQHSCYLVGERMYYDSSARAEENEKTESVREH